jgi:hypothetical protein
VILDVLFGTLFGEICLADPTSRKIKSIQHLGSTKRDTILGLCWLRNSHSKFISGSSAGRASLCDIDTGKIIKDYPRFDRLTSCNVNCSNDSLILSGYQNTVKIFDLETGKPTRELKSIHNDHINISRFCNTSPFLFATCSFDSTIKTWDLRQKGPPGQSENFWLPEQCDTKSCGPIWTLKCKSGVVMVHFSSDDSYLLASALDNEIKQINFSLGKVNFDYKLQSIGLDGNFTRAYFSASGRYTITGSCEESNIKFLCTHTGELLHTIPIYPDSRDKSLYIQSLRGNPRTDEEFCVLSNYHTLPYRQLVMGRVVNMAHRHEKLESYGPDYSEAKSLSEHTPRKEDEGKAKTVASPFNLISLMNSTHYLVQLKELRVQAQKATNSIANGHASEGEFPNLIGLTHIDVKNGKDHLSKILYPRNHWKSSSDVNFEAYYQEILTLYDNLQFSVHCVDTICIQHTFPKLFSTYIDVKTKFGARLIDLSTIVDPENWIFLSLFIDFCYIGTKSITVTTIQAYTLLYIIQYFDLDEEKWEAIMKSAVLKAGDYFYDRYYYKFHAKIQEKRKKLQKLANKAEQSDSNSSRAHLEDESDHEVELIDPPHFVIPRFCQNENIWRRSSFFSCCLFDVIQRMYVLARTLECKGIEDALNSVLVAVLSPFNVVNVAKWALQQDSQTVVLEACAHFMLNCADAVIMPDGLSLRFKLNHPDLAANIAPTEKEKNSDPDMYLVKKVYQLMKERVVSVSTTKDVLRQRKLIAKHVYGLDEQSQPFKNESLVLLEEVPYAPALSNESIARSKESNRSQSSALPPPAPIVLSKPNSIIAPATRTTPVKHTEQSKFQENDEVEELQGTMPLMAIPKYNRHKSCVLANRFLIQFAGMNRDRYQSLSHLLAYDISQDRFVYLPAAWHKIPYSVIMCLVLAV